MGLCMSSEAAAEKPKSLAKLDKLTSDAYGPKNLPAHWSDTVFLVPHEWLRREMNGLAASVKALPDSPTDEDAWKAELLGTWIVDFFAKMIHLHHENEEKIYIPFMIEKGCDIPEKKIAADHEELMKMLGEIGELGKALKEKEGKDCASEIASLKEKVEPFNKDMREHLKEEEETMSKAIKAKIEQKESDETVNKIIQAGGVEGLQTELPGIVDAAKDWCTDEFYNDFTGEVPPPIFKLCEEIFLPNYKSYWCAMRDAPTMSEKPGLEQIPFDPSMLPPPPPEAADQ